VTSIHTFESAEVLAIQTLVHQEPTWADLGNILQK